ncbi:MAG: ribonuclease H-like domain-containing protein [Candidatus Aenigmarchaeota archaeon]|nr:ribonuclease H-like domain-containing protein [Candidatus Aenigmarchaeota archaeon]
MQTVKARLVDITYKVESGKPVVLLFCRTQEGRKICIKDNSFEPYFTVICGKDALHKIRALTVNEDGMSYRITRIDEVHTKLAEKPTLAFKVFCNIPKAVPKLRDLARAIPEVSGVYEDDILFVRRYLIDKDIKPLNMMTATGDFIEDKSVQVPVFKAEKVEKETSESSLPRTLAFDIETYYNPAQKAIDPANNPALMIALYGRDFECCITWKNFPHTDKRIIVVEDEAAMLRKFVELVNKYEPDILTGYNSDGFDFPYLAKRASILKLQLSIGLDGSNVMINGRTVQEAEICGITHIDLFKFVRHVMVRSLKTDVYTLDAVSTEVLGEGKIVVDLDTLHQLWTEASQELEKFCKYNIHDCKLTYLLCEKYFPTMNEFVNLIGLPLTSITRMSFSTLVEWYIIKKAVLSGEIILQKPRNTDERKRMHQQVKGGFVFEPTPGIYKNIAVFDYRSLYPSIIASHNISIGTLRCECCKNTGRVPTDRGDFWFCTKNKGFLASIIEEIINARAVIKAELKKKKDNLLSARSEALKVLANSFYGYLGFAPARWYAFECAEATTAWGRHHIQSVIAEAQNQGFTVIYSDTDSVFLLLGERTKQDIMKFQEQINKNLPGLMELDFEGVYQSGIFVSTKTNEGGAKKKYALLDEHGIMKVRGFETVRRNSSFIAKDVQKEVLEILLKENDVKKAATFVKKIIEQMQNNQIPLDKVVIHTQLQKAIESYESFGPHVAAAMRMREKGQEVSAGTMIKFIVVKGAGKIRDKVRLPDETKQTDYDSEYYINNQIIPSVERIFAVLGISNDELQNKPVQSTLGKWRP